jgi:hypothetical protein
MTPARLSQLHKRLLRWLAVDHERTQERRTSSHQELGRAPRGDQGKLSHSLRTLEARVGWCWAAPLARKPNPSCLPERVRSGPATLQEVVIKKKRMENQIVMSTGMRGS